MIDLWGYRAKLDRVIDGDSIRVLVDHGMRIHSTQSIRLAGIDTPELFSGTDRVRGSEARDFTKVWFAVHHHGNEWPVVVRTEKDKQSFNRYVGTIHCWQGHDLTAELKEAGFDE